MPTRLQRSCAVLALILLLAPFLCATAYEGRPRLIVVIVIDQFRGDSLERNRDRFGEGGFRLFLDHGAVFTNCNYDYANTRTGPGHATLMTGAYSNGHGIAANRWWDQAANRAVAAIQDDAWKILGAGGPGGSPRKLLADTLGDELKLATGGKSRVFALSLKESAAVLSGGYAANAAYWTADADGAWITSSYYMSNLPAWVKQFNENKRATKYWNLEWKDSSGKVLGNTAPEQRKDGNPASFYDVVGSTPFGNDYEFEFARELVVYEKLGSGPNTDLLIVSLSANDVLGHRVGPDAPETTAMALALDRQLADFFSFLGRHLGLANVWLALSADHGMAPLPAHAAGLHLPAANFDPGEMRARVNRALSSRWSPGHNVDYVKLLDWPIAYLSEEAFAAANLRQPDAERAVGEALMKEPYVRGYFTRSQLAQGLVPADEMGRKYAHSYSPYGGWYVMAVPAPFIVGNREGGDHSTPYTYDTHVPLTFYGLAFQPGTYRGHAEPVDLAVTLASLLGINPPTHAVGRVLTEAIAAPREAKP